MDESDSETNDRAPRRAFLRSAVGVGALGLGLASIENGKAHSADTDTGSIGNRATQANSDLWFIGIQANQWQSVFNRAVRAGGWLYWRDAYDIDGRPHFNAIFRRPTTVPWRARFGMSGSAYQEVFNRWTSEGYRLYRIESYLDGDDVRYAATFRRTGGPPWRAYHGVSAAGHQNRFEEFREGNYVPVNVPVVSVGGNRVYAGFWERKNVGRWRLRSSMTESQAQQEFENNREMGLTPVYLNAYLDGGLRYSGIWNAATQGQIAARSRLTRSQFVSEHRARTADDFRLEVVTGHAEGGSSRYAGIWRKPPSPAVAGNIAAATNETAGDETTENQSVRSDTRN